MTVWQNRIFRRCLAGRPYPRDTRETQLSSSVLTLCIPIMCRVDASFRGMLSHEILAKTLMSSIAWVFTLFLYHTTLTIKSHNKYRVQKIEQNYNQIWHGIKANKNIVVNYNFTISPFGYSVTKPLKQTLDLNVSLGTVAKLTHT